MTTDLIKEDWFWSFISSLLLLLSILFIWRQLRIQGYSHNLQSMFALNARWNSQEMTLARKEVCTNHNLSGQLNRPEEFVAMFFEDLGNYVNQGALPMRFVWSAYSYEIEHYWPMLKDAVIDRRRRLNDKTIYTDFEILHDRCKRYGRWQNRWRFSLLPVDINHFVKSEAQKINYYSDLQDKIKLILPNDVKNG